MKIFLLILAIALKGLSQAQVDLNELCLDQAVDDVLPHPLDCNSYIVCHEEEPTVHNCEMGFHFDAKRKVCNWPENANCQVVTTPQPIEPTDSGTTDKPIPQSSLMALDVLTGEIVDPLSHYDPENVICRHFGAYFLPHPKQCRSYYICAYGHMHEHSCGKGTLWNYLTQQCVLNHMAECYHLTEEEEVEIENTLAANTDNPLMVCYPISTTTIGYIEVTTPAVPATSQPTRTNKPTTTYRPTTRPPTQRPNSSNPYHIVCPPKRQSYAAHPKDCGKYFMCIMGNPILTSCPVGLYWDSQKEYCDLPENVKCFQ